MKQNKTGIMHVIRLTIAMHIDHFYVQAHYHSSKWGCGNCSSCSGGALAVITSCLVIPSNPFFCLILNDVKDMCISYRLQRMCKESCIVNGIQMKRGLAVIIPVYHLHRNEELWENPHKFDPDRYIYIHT